MNFEFPGFHQDQVYDSAPHYAPYSRPPPSSAPPDPTAFAYYHANAPPPMSCDIKPRLTKEQHDILEAHYQKQHKPNTNTKKGFAEHLNVSLDKVNNWFQNRRAKSKQDAKKQAGAFNLLHVHSQHASSDSDTSPAFTTPEYYHMMHTWAGDEQMPHGLGIAQMQQQQQQQQQQQPQEQSQTHYGLPMNKDVVSSEMLLGYGMSAHPGQEFYDSPQEVNRRTLTQEQFDAFSRNMDMGHESVGMDDFHTGFSGDQDILGQVLPEFHDDFKADSFGFPHPPAAPLSSNDSTVPSTVSEQSMLSYLGNMQDPSGNASAASSEYGDSQISSVSNLQSEPQYSKPMSSAPPHALTSTAQWQPDQSVPVDFNALSQEFKHFSQARHSPPQPGMHNQPLGWPSEDAYGTRDTQAAMLAQSMGSFGLHTPQPPQDEAFKPPAPAGNIAARRQRPRPAALSLRSQSYHGGAPAPATAGAKPGPPLPQANGGQPLRRIRSSNVVNGVAQGRVMKAGVGSAQRSPMSWNFTESLNSPKLARHVSSHSLSHQASQADLAPPTPRSPSEMAWPDQPGPRQFPSWQPPHAQSSGQGHVCRQPSISESELEHAAAATAAAATTAATAVPPRHPSGSAPPPPQQPTFSSPPHTPRYPHPSQLHHPHQQQYPPPRIASNVITEATPPQSAPASQPCFPANPFLSAHASMHHQQQPAPYSHVPFQPHMQMQPTMVSQPPPHQQHQQQQQHHMNMLFSDQMMDSTTFATSPHPDSNGPAPPPGIPKHYPNGIPIVNADGNIEMAFPTIPYPPPREPARQPPSQTNYTFIPSPSQPSASPSTSHQTQPTHITSKPPSTNANANNPSAAPDFFVHEYTPPSELKQRGGHAHAIPRKPVGEGAREPKNFVFSNTGPGDFEGRGGLERERGRGASGGSSGSGSAREEAEAGGIPVVVGSL